MRIDKKNIEELVKYLKEFNLSEIEYAEGSTKVKVSRATNSSNIISADINKKKLIIESNGINVTSDNPKTTVQNVKNPRKELDENSLEVENKQFLDLGLVPIYVKNKDYLDELYNAMEDYKENY